MGAVMVMVAAVARAMVETEADEAEGRAMEKAAAARAEARAAENREAKAARGERVVRAASAAATTAEKVPREVMVEGEVETEATAAQSCSAPSGRPRKGQRMCWPGCLCRSSRCPRRTVREHSVGRTRWSTWGAPTRPFGWGRAPEREASGTCHTRRRCRMSCK